MVGEQLCQDLNRTLMNLRREMAKEVIMRRQMLIMRAGNWVDAATFVLTIASAAFPPLGLAFPVGVVAKLGLTCVDELYNVVDWQRGKTWKDNMERVEQRCPKLRKLHAGLAENGNYLITLEDFQEMVGLQQNE